MGCGPIEGANIGVRAFADVYTDVFARCEQSLRK